MDRRDVSSNLAKVEALFNERRHDEAMELLQTCINTSRLESKEFMEYLRDSTKDSEILDRLVYMYSMNFV